MAPPTAAAADDDEAASLALIAQLIAEGYCEGRIGSSVEDYEEPLSSYERGLIEDPENVNHGPDGSAMWGEGVGDGGDVGVEWDGGVAEGFVDEGDDGGGFGGYGGEGEGAVHRESNEMQGGSDREVRCLGQSVEVPGVGRCRSVGGSRDVPNLEAVETNIAGHPAEADLHSRKEDIDDSAGTPGAHPPIVSRLTDEEEIGRAIVGPEPTHFNSTWDTVQWDDQIPTHRPSAFDRYTGLDVNFSYRNGKNKVETFDDPTEYEPTEADYNRIFETLFKNPRTKDLGRRQNESKELCSPWIRIPYLGRRGGGFAEFDAKSEDTEVVEIRLDDDYGFFENKPGDIANNQSLNRNDKAYLRGTQTSNEIGDLDQEVASKYVDAPGNSWAKESAWEKYDRDLFQMSEDQEVMNKHLGKSSDKVHVEKNVGVQQETPGEKHNSPTLRSSKSIAISTCIEGPPLEPGDDTILDATPPHCRRVRAYEKNPTHNGPSIQMPENTEEANKYNESLTPVLDNTYTADDEAEISFSGRQEHWDHQPTFERKRSRGRSSTGEEFTMAQEHGAIVGDGVQRGRPLFRRGSSGRRVRSRRCVTR